MARFIDSQGNWVDTEAPQELESFYSSLVPSMDLKKFPTLDQPQVQAVVQEKANQQKRIDTFTESMAPLAQTTFGEDALKGLLSDSTADMEQRAGAAQALYPGTKVTVGKHGELSFTAKSVDMGFNYPNSGTAYQNPTQQVADKSVQQSDALKNFDDRFRAIQGMADPTDIMNAYAALQADANTYVTGKTAALEQRIGKALGYDQLQQQLATDRQLDQNYYNQYYGGQYLGPSQESLQNISAFSTVKSQRDQQVSEVMSRDPDIIALKSKMAILDNLIKQRVSETTPTTGAGLVPEEDVDKILMVQGVDPNKAKENERFLIKSQIAKNDAVTMAKLTIASSGPVQNLTAAAMSQGPQAQWALNAAKAQFDTPDLPSQLINEFRQFDSKYLPQIPKDQQSLYKLSQVDQAGSKAQVEARKMEIAQNKMQFIVSNQANARQAAFGQSVINWAVPQDQTIAPEVKATIEIVQRQRQQENSTAPITIDDLISRMDWDNDPSGAKRDAMIAYINSQAATVSDQKVFGPVPVFSDPQMTRGFVDGIIVSQRFRNLGIRGGSAGYYGGPAQDAMLTSQGYRSQIQ